MLIETAFLDCLADGQKTVRVEKEQLESFISNWFSFDKTILIALCEDLVPYVFETDSLSRLKSIFTFINVLDTERATDKVINPTTIETCSYFESSPELFAYSESIKRHVGVFRREARTLIWVSPINFYHRFFALFKKYTVNVAAFIGIDTHPIALFEQHKVQTVFLNGQKEVFLIDYDISGVQSFLYEITDGSATKANIAKSLRGRSFYLSLLCDFIGYSLLNHFDLPYEFFLNSAGGKGSVAVPCSEGAEEGIKKIKTDIERMLFNSHHLKLSVSFAIRKVSQRHLFELESYRGIVIEESLSSSKKQKFSSIIETFNEAAMKASANRCKLCGAATDENTYCKTCADVLAISEVITRGEELTLGYAFDDNYILTKGQTFHFGSMGCVIVVPLLEPDVSRCKYLVSVNHAKLGEVLFYPIVFGRGGKFAEIAEERNLAVVKMDIDNLGKIFINGFKLDQKNYLQFLTLSRELDFFFKRSLQAIALDAKYEGRVIVLYAGGDDLVIICPGDHVLLLLNDINERLNSYVCGNSKIHMSAGIEIFKPKTPIRLAVRFAEKQLELAKNQTGKNNFSIMDHPVSNERLRLMNDDFTDLSSMVAVSGLSKGLIYKIYLALEQSLGKKSPLASFYAEMPQLSYSIARLPNNQIDLKRRLMGKFIRADFNGEDLRYYHTLLAFLIMKIRKKEAKLNDY